VATVSVCEWQSCNDLTEYRIVHCQSAAEFTTAWTDGRRLSICLAHAEAAKAIGVTVYRDTPD
jgi:hypothetical protein